MDSAQNSDLTPIFSDLNQSENLSEVKPPLGTQTTPPSTLSTHYTASAAVAVRCRRRAAVLQF